MDELSGTEVEGRVVQEYLDYDGEIMVKQEVEGLGVNGGRVVERKCWLRSDQGKD